MRSTSLAAPLAVIAALFAGVTAAQGPAANAAYVVPADTPANIRRAVESPDRVPEQRARDAERHPAEVLTMAGLKTGDRVIEFAGFGNYYTDILSPAVGPAGEVHMIDLPYTEARAGEASRAFVAAHPNTTYTVVDYNDAKLPQNVDIVFMILYYHDLGPQGVDTIALDRKIFAALKPGGRFVVVDHKAEAGSGWRDAGTIHRIGVETIRREVQSVGFDLTVDSDLLAHPEDDHSVMVFAPGTRGATDRALFVFRKPEK